MNFFYSLLLALFLIACADSTHKNQITYKFTDQKGEPIKIQSDFNTFDIYTDTSKPQDIEKTTFIMFFDLNSNTSKDYIITINNLEAAFPKAYVVGILTQKYPKEDVQNYIRENNIHFTVLNPSDSKNIFNDFTKKITEENKKTDAADNPDESNAQTNPMIELPFFVLYNRHGEKYQTYSGIIPEEMFAHDINSLRH